MEWWNDELTTTVTQAAIWVVSALLALWRAGAFRVANEWAATLKDARVATVANKLINWADAELSGEPGKAKLDKVLGTDVAQKLGIDRADVEAALAARDAANGKADQLASELSAATSRIATLEAQLAALATITASPALTTVADQVAAAQTTVGKAQEFSDAIGGLPGSVTGAIAHAQDLSARLRGGGV